MDAQGRIVGSLALLDDLGPDSGSAPVLPTRTQPKRRRDDLLGRNLPFAHNSIARPESIARRGAAPYDRIGFGRGLLGRPHEGECRKREMLTREGDDEKEARRSPTTTVHNVRVARTHKNQKKKRMGKEEGGERTKRTQALPDTNGPADESGARTERKVSRNQGQEAGNNLGGGSSREPTSSDTRCRMHFDHHSSGCCILARQSSLPNRPTPPYCTHTSIHPVRHAPGSKKKLHSHVFSFRKLSTQSFHKKKGRIKKKKESSGCGRIRIHFHLHVRASCAAASAASRTCGILRGHAMARGLGIDHLVREVAQL